MGGRSGHDAGLVRHLGGAARGVHAGPDGLLGDDPEAAELRGAVPVRLRPRRHGVVRVDVCLLVEERRSFDKTRDAVSHHRRGHDRRP